MKLNVKSIGNYKELVLEVDHTTIESGLLDKDEAEALAQSLRAAADELSEADS